jgi:hypothetical protein
MILVKNMTTIFEVIEVVEIIKIVEIIGIADDVIDEKTDIEDDERVIHVLFCLHSAARVTNFLELNTS